MKKFAKGCLIFAGIAAAIGVVLCVIGMVLGGEPRLESFWKSYLSEPDRLEISTEWYNDEPQTIEVTQVIEDGGNYDISEEASDQITNIAIELNAGSIQIKESSDDQIHLFVDSSRGGVKVDTSDNTLELIERTEKNWVWRNWYRNGHNKGSKISLYLPADKHFENVSIEVEAGDADVTQYALQAEYMTLSIGAGQFDIADMNVGEAELDCGVGELNVAGRASGNITADCGVGEINLTLSDEQDNFNYSIDCGIGEVILGGDSYSSLGVSREIDNDAEKKMELDCGVGQIHVEYR